MKERKKINLIKVVSTAIVGVGLITGRQVAEDIKRSFQDFDCKSSLTCPPPDNITIKARTFNNSFVTMEEVLEWNTDKKRWQITNREWKAIPQKETFLGIFDEYNQRSVESDLIRREKFFATPTNTKTCKLGVWDNSGFGYKYCWDKSTGSWQQVSREILTNTMR